MNRTAIKFGIFGGSALIFFSMIPLIFSDKIASLENNFSFNYFFIILSLSSIYAGIRFFRDKKQNGFISTELCMGIGIYITILSAVIFSMYSYFLFSLFEPSILTAGLNQTITNIKISKESVKEISADLENLKSMSRFYINPFYKSLLIFITIFGFGFVISLFSTLALKNKPKTMSSAV